MSPRSSELQLAARRRLRTAVAAADQDPSGAISLGCYSMLYAARAALSERELQSRSHRERGTSFDESSAEDAERILGTAERFLEAVGDLVE